MGDEDVITKECFTINSKKHELFTIKTEKVAMRNKVVKRIPGPNFKFESLPFGAVPPNFA